MKVYHADAKQEKVGVTILIIDKVHLKAKGILGIKMHIT